MHVQRNKLNVTRICGHFFKPGINHIPDHLIDRLLNDRQFKYELQAGSMTILGSKSSAEIDSSGPEPGPEMSVKEMMTIIQKTFDPETLDHFESVDDRKTVRKAIRKQRRLITPPPPEPEEEETEPTETPD